MTRINSAIPVKKLTDEHLLAEHREIKRLPDNFLKALQTNAFKKIPQKFCLGTGHVTFFLNKQLFCLIRYNEIHNECSRRGFHVTYYASNWIALEQKMQQHNCFNNYMPTDEERAMLEDRIATRILESKKANFHYYGKPISKEEAIDLLLS